MLKVNPGLKRDIELHEIILKNSIQIEYKSNDLSSNVVANFSCN